MSTDAPDLTDREVVLRFHREQLRAAKARTKAAYTEYEAAVQAEAEATRAVMELENAEWRGAETRLPRLSRGDRVVVAAERDAFLRGETPHPPNVGKIVVCDSATAFVRFHKGYARSYNLTDLGLADS